MVLVSSAGRQQSAPARVRLARPWAWAGVVLVAGAFAGAVLAATLRVLPAGVSYSDSYMWLDAAHRIAAGERPHVDFFSPVGPAPFYLFAALVGAAPSLQPVLAAQFGYALLTGAVLWPVVAGARLRAAAAWTAVVFVLLALAPYNWGDAKGFVVGPLVDGYGVYNRQAGLALFALAAAAWLQPRVRLQAAASAVLLPILFFTKLTAFPLGLAVAAWGLLRRRAGGAAWLFVAAPSLLAALGAQLAGGLTVHYLHDLARLGAMGGIWALRDRLQDELNSARPILILLLAPIALQLWRDAPAARLRRPPLRLGLALLRTRTAGLVLLVAGGLIVESQNTGSQAYAFVIPAALALAPRRPRSVAGRLGQVAGAAPALLASLYLCASFAALARAAPGLVPLHGLALDRLHVAAQPDDLAAARRVLAEMKRDPSLLAGRGRETIETRLGDGPQSEVVFLLEIEDAAQAVSRWRRLQGAPDASLATLDFVDPFGFLLGVAPVRGLDIVYDPERTLPPTAVAPLNAAWARADLLLARRCLGVDEVVALARPALAGRRRVRLDPCWDLYVR